VNQAQSQPQTDRIFFHVGKPGARAVGVMAIRRLPKDPRKSAKLAGLRYIHCGIPGIQRKRAGKGFAYFDVDSHAVRDRETLGRIRSLVLPPAWQSVWICPFSDGHLQATGVDARGRRQYRYHPHYRRIRNHTKFHRMLDFAKALPKIRAHVEKNLKLPGLPRPKVIATIVKLLETTFIRVGNEEYAQENSSFGLTTLRDRHVRIEGGTLRLQFRGKSAQMHDVAVEDKRLARIIRDCRDLPGYELFQYVDDLGEIHSVDSSDVNGYLHEISGEEFTAKDFRTWAGTIQTALVLAESEVASSESAAKRTIVAAIKQTAARLGNRPATCRNYYVHPTVIDSWLDGTLPTALKAYANGSAANHDFAGLHPEEASVIALIRKRSAALIESVLPVRAA
jgi:DNA topoisomerase-1